MLLARRTAARRPARSRSARGCSPTPSRPSSGSAGARGGAPRPRVQNLLSARHELQEAGEERPHPALERADARSRRRSGSSATPSSTCTHTCSSRPGSRPRSARSPSRPRATRGSSSPGSPLHEASSAGAARLLGGARAPRNVVRHADAKQFSFSSSGRDGAARAGGRGRRPRVPAGAPRGATRRRPHRPRDAARPRGGGGRDSRRRLGPGRRHAGGYSTARLAGLRLAAPKCPRDQACEQRRAGRREDEGHREVREVGGVEVMSGLVQEDEQAEQRQLGERSERKCDDHRPRHVSMELRRTLERHPADGRPGGGCASRHRAATYIRPIVRSSHARPRPRARS